jgi:hypothetical protein
MLYLCVCTRILLFELVISYQKKFYNYVLLFGQWCKMNMALLRAELMTKLRS